MARQQARRHQRERAAGIVVFCLGIVVLVVAVLALRQPNGHVSTASTRGSASSVAKQSTTKTSSKPPATSRSSRSTSPAASVKAVPLIVLNNSTVKGLAAQAARQFETDGWKVTSSGNLTNTIVSTCAYYDDSDPAAKAAAEALQAEFPSIKRVKPKFPELPSGPVVVVLTGDYRAA